MSFNATKCKLLSITNKKPNKTPASLSILSALKPCLQPTSTTTWESDAYRRDLRWSSHCTKICNKANKRLGLLRRTLKPCDKSVKEQAYLSMVRPLVEYATSAWSPYNNSDVSKLEQLKKNAARFVANNYDPYSSSSSIVSSLNWTPLDLPQVDSLIFFDKKLKRAKTPEINRLNRVPKDRKKYLNRAKDFAKVYTSLENRRLLNRGHTRRFYTPTAANFVACKIRKQNSLVSDMLDIDDFIRQSLRSAKFAIAVGDTQNEFRQSMRSAYKIA